jgi:hypothetical protein
MLRQHILLLMNKMIFYLNFGKVRDHIRKTLFSLQLKNEANKPEYCITLGQKCLQSKTL